MKRRKSTLKRKPLGKRSGKESKNKKAISRLTVSKLKKALDGIMREIIRIRDNNTCQWCGKSIFGRDSQPSHVKPKSIYGFLRFDEQNIKLLCLHCHRKWHLDPLLAKDWFKLRFPDRYEYLEKRGTQQKQWKTWELLELIDKKKRQLK